MWWYDAATSIDSPGQRQDLQDLLFILVICTVLTWRHDACLVTDFCHFYVHSVAAFAKVDLSCRQCPFRLIGKVIIATEFRARAAVHHDGVAAATGRRFWHNKSPWKSVLQTAYGLSTKSQIIKLRSEVTTNLDRLGSIANEATKPFAFNTSATLNVRVLMISIAPLLSSCPTSRYLPPSI